MNAITKTRGWEFDRPVPPHGYAWWYVDALSDDGRHGITIIAFIGTVFSPWYAWSRRWGAGDPENHCCMNVALYGAPRRWAMTDRPRTALQRGPDFLQIGPSGMEWDGNALTIRIEEVTAPIPSRLRGTVRVIPQAISTRSFLLDAAGRHRWQPIAARSRVEVALESPRAALVRPGLFRHQCRRRAAGAGFRRLGLVPRADAGPDGGAVQRAAARRHGAVAGLARRRRWTVEDIEPPPAAALPRGSWGVARPARSEDGRARLVRPLEDTPFYTRSEIRTRLLGREAATAVHESLALDRFAALPIQVMLPVKVPRAFR